MGAPWPIPNGFEDLIREHVERQGRAWRGHLSIYDFAGDKAVRFTFPDGSLAHFNFAFFIQHPTRRVVAVFTEHCGYHVFPSGEVSVVVAQRTRFNRDSS